MPTTWDELMAIAGGVYVGPWTAASQTSAQLGCVDTARALKTNAHDAQPRLCLDRVSALNGAPWLPSPTAAEAWVMTGRHGTGEAFSAAAGSQDALLDLVKCSLLDRVWQHVPDDHRRCDDDSDCETLSATCFSTPIATAHAAPYRALIQKAGAVCLHPAGGMCPPSWDEAQCRKGRCTMGDPSDPNR